VAVEVLSGTAVTHRGARLGVAGGNLDIAQADPGVEHGGDEGLTLMCGCRLVIRRPATILIRVICVGVLGPGAFLLPGLVATSVVVRRALHPVPVLRTAAGLGAGCASCAGRGVRDGLFESVCALAVVLWLMLGGGVRSGI